MTPVGKLDAWFCFANPVCCYQKLNETEETERQISTSAIWRTNSACVFATFFFCNFDISLSFSIAVLQPTHLADFNQVQTIQYSNSEDKDRKGMLQLKIAGAPEVRY